MTPVKHPDCNDVLRGGAPHVPDLHIRRGNESDDGSMPVVASFWKPTATELQRLIDGGCVEVVVIGHTHPPISVRAAPSKCAGAGAFAGWKLMPPRLTGDMRVAMVGAALRYMRATGGNSPEVMYEAAFAAAPSSE